MGAARTGADRDSAVMDQPTLHYRIIDHTADMGMVVKAGSIRELFSCAAYAMTRIMVEGDFGNEKTERKISIDAEDYPDLMVRWLGEILYLFAGEGLIADAVEIHAVSRTNLSATLAMSAYLPGRHRVLREIKAVTYHDVSVGRTDDEWETRIIFDI